MMGDDRKVSIIGTGVYGRALGRRLFKAGYEVTFGSRSPKDAQCIEEECHFRFVRTEQAFDSSPIIILAIPSDVVLNTVKPFVNSCKDKIIIEVSNPCKATRDKEDTIVESLAELLSTANVIKAFNNISAYTLDTLLYQESADVLIAGDCSDAKRKVSLMVNSIGFRAVDVGQLHQARAMEKMSKEFWRGWGTPLIVTLIWLVLWTIYGIWRHHLIKGHPWDKFPLYTFNKAIGSVAITMLAMCFIPGPIVIILRFVWRIKNVYGYVPKPLVNWLEMRKQMGLISLWLSVFHCMASLVGVMSNYFPDWYTTEYANIESGYNTSVFYEVPIFWEMNWKGQTTLFSGFVTLGMLVVPGLTSLPSVGQTLNWRQWRFAQSQLGVATVVVALGHIMVKGIPKWITQTPLKMSQGMSFISCLLPGATVVLWVFAQLPCFNKVYKLKSNNGYNHQAHKKGDVKLDIENSRM